MSEEVSVMEMEQQPQAVRNYTKGTSPKGYISKNYGNSAQIRYIHEKCVIPIGCIKSAE